MSLLSMNKGSGAFMAPSRSAVFCFHSSFFSLDDGCPPEGGWEGFSSTLKSGSVSMVLSSSGSGGKSMALGGGAMGGGGGGISSSEEFTSAETTFAVTECTSAEESLSPASGNTGTILR